MLREDGIVLDDGTTSRLADDHFVMTTTTANAGRVMSHIEFCHQALWPDLDVTYVSVTEQWAQMAIAGPKSRATLQKIVDGVILDDTTFPYLAAKEISVLGGIPARLFRISFSGEHAYELAVPADYGSMAASRGHEGRRRVRHRALWRRSAFHHAHREGPRGRQASSTARRPRPTSGSAR